MSGSGGSPGAPGPGVTHAHGFCPKCHRNVAGGVDHSTGRIWLRRHKTQPRGGKWCGEDGKVTYAMTGQDLALAFIRGEPVPGAPDPHPGYLDFVRKTVLSTMTPLEWLASVSPEAAAGGASPKAGPAAPSTGCPACGSDDYDTALGQDGMPDYEHGPKTCQGCRKAWV